MRRYKADIYMMTELFINNDVNQGCDPDSCYDNGLVYTITKQSLGEIKSEILSMYDGIEHFEDNRFETSYETTQRDGTIESVMVSIYITEIIENDLNNISDLFLIKVTQ